MAFARMNFNKGKEKVLAPEGEYDLVVRRFNKKKKKGDSTREMYVAEIGFASEKEYSNIIEYLSIPNEANEEEANERCIRKIRRFLYWFDIDFEEDGFDDENVQGATATLKVRIDEPEEGSEFPPKNVLVLPRVPEENEQDDDED